MINLKFITYGCIITAISFINFASANNKAYVKGFWNASGIVKDSLEGAKFKKDNEDQYPTFDQGLDTWEKPKYSPDFMGLGASLGMNLKGFGLELEFAKSGLMKTKNPRINIYQDLEADKEKVINHFKQDSQESDIPSKEPAQMMTAYFKSKDFAYSTLMANLSYQLFSLPKIADINIIGGSGFAKVKRDGFAPQYSGAFQAKIDSTFNAFKHFKPYLSYKIMRVCQKDYSANKVNSFIPDIDFYYQNGHSSLWGGVDSNSVNLSNNDDIKFKSAYILQGVEVGFKLYV